MQYVISFLEGIITFISPCLLPMLPIYISYFAGGGERKTSKTVVSALGFVTGFTLVFVSLQWGPDLLLFRPFLDVSPFVGYALNNEFTASTATAAKLSAGFANKWDGINRLEYGLGLGGGLEIWKVQVVCRYNWNFGQLFDASGKASGADTLFGNVKESIFDGKNFGGVTLSVALLF